MEIKELIREEYAGKPFTVRYKTAGYYDIEAKDCTFKITLKPFEGMVAKSFTDTFFNKWLEAPKAYGAFEGDKLIGFVEGTIEEWNNRYRITNICIFDETDRHRGVGSVLMRQILKKAHESGARMAVLETQTCNTVAISFYKSFGFEIIGFDLYSYSNDDPEKKEVRLEMGKKLETTVL